MPPLTFKRFQSVLSRMPMPAKPEERISLEAIGECCTPLALNHDEKYGVPTLEELGRFERRGVELNFNGCFACCNLEYIYFSTEI